MKEDESIELDYKNNDNRDQSESDLPPGDKDVNAVPEGYQGNPLHSLPEGFGWGLPNLDAEVRKALEKKNKDALKSLLIKAKNQSCEVDDFPISQPVREECIPLLNTFFNLDFLKEKNTGGYSIFFYFKDIEFPEGKLKEIAYEKIISFIEQAMAVAERQGHRFFITELSKECFDPMLVCTVPYISTQYPLKITLEIVQKFLNIALTSESRNWRVCSFLLKALFLFENYKEFLHVIEKDLSDAEIKEILNWGWKSPRPLGKKFSAYTYFFIRNALTVEELEAFPRVVKIVNEINPIPRAYAGCEKIKEYIVRGGSLHDPAFGYERTLTPLQYAIYEGSLEFAEWLVLAGANTDTLKNGTLELALHSSNSPDNMELVKWLIERGADVNEKCKRGYSVLWTALYWKAYKCAQALIESGAKYIVSGRPRSVLEFITEKISAMDDSLDRFSKLEGQGKFLLDFITRLNSNPDIDFEAALDALIKDHLPSDTTNSRESFDQLREFFNSTFHKMVENGPQVKIGYTFKDFALARKVEEGRSVQDVIQAEISNLQESKKNLEDFKQWFENWEKKSSPTSPAMLVSVLRDSPARSAPQHNDNNVPGASVSSNPGVTNS
ncbi:MAG: ankyrin repeat domain-containing protein, partial [Gammaproteobacteria bacterium]|nr:ankyrin repeat domain-containing protein [Gammaproteobacteria bacterium]